MDKKNKPSWYIIFIIAVSVIVLVIASVIIYSSFFEKDINKEKNKKIAEDYMSEKLEESKVNSAKIKENNDAIISKYGLDITGTYSCTYNELSTKDGSSYTDQVTRTLNLMDDSTAVFDDGTKAWWSLRESNDGTVHLGLVVPDEEIPQLYLVCDDALIDEGGAVFIGEVPESKYFDKEYKTSGLTLTFSSDGSVDGEIVRTVKEGDIEYPLTEAYAGKYQRNGEYIDIVFNGAPAKYYIFNNTKANPGLRGFATNYYIKNK